MSPSFTASRGEEVGGWVREGGVALEVAVRRAGTDSWTDPPAGSQVWELSERSEARPRSARLHPRVQEPWQETFHQRMSGRAAGWREGRAGGWASGACRRRMLCPHRLDSRCGSSGWLRFLPIISYNIRKTSPKLAVQALACFQST